MRTKFSRRTQIGLRQIRNVTFVACVIAPTFSILVGQGPKLNDGLQGLVDGALIALGLGAYIYLGKNGILRPFFRRLSFIQGLIINAIAYLAIFLLFRGLGQFATTLDFRRFFHSFADTGLIPAIPFAFTVAFLIEFFVQMNRMVGANVLRYFVTGAYHQPKEEERVFMFLDLQGSTTLTESLGGVRYYELLRDFVDAISDPILEAYGHIHEYAGDEVVITWTRSDAYRDANCVRCFFLIDDAIAASASRFEQAYGIVPQFRAGLHGGNVIVGELGDIHQEIVYVGDILNVAARLEEYAKHQGRRLVTSSAILGAITLPAELESAPLGEFQPRGKAAPMPVFEVRRKNQSA
jgi:adenylate cyclase